MRCANACTFTPTPRDIQQIHIIPYAALAPRRKLPHLERFVSALCRRTDKRNTHVNARLCFSVYQAHGAQRPENGRRSSMYAHCDHRTYSASFRRPRKLACSGTAVVNKCYNNTAYNTINMLCYTMCCLFGVHKLLCCVTSTARSMGMSMTTVVVLLSSTSLVDTKSTSMWCVCAVFDVTTAYSVPLLGPSTRASPLHPPTKGKRKQTSKHHRASHHP